jgi:fibronectin-binding autotransporter adhesin
VVTTGPLDLTNNGSISSSAGISLAASQILDVSGRSDKTLNLASGQTLQGSGTINGNLVALSGSTLSPGLNGAGTLTVTNSAALGGNTIMGVGIGSNNLFKAASITYGGTLSLSFVPGSIAAGANFTLFNASSYSGSFASITPQPGPGLQWVTPQLDTTGTIGVQAIRAATFSPSFVSGTNLTLNGAGGTTNGTYRVYTSTNISLAVTNWREVGTGTFTGSGNFSFGVTNTNNAAQFYILEEP